MYIVLIETELSVSMVEYPTYTEAIFWSRYYELLPGVWAVWVTDETWGSVLYECGVTVGL